MGPVDTLADWKGIRPYIAGSRANARDFIEDSPMYFPPPYRDRK